MCRRAAHGRRALLSWFAAGLFVIGMCGSAYAHMDMANMTKKKPVIGFKEKLGAYVPPDITFTDENGKDVRLGELIDKPTILSLVYFHCPDVCNLLLAGMADMLSRLDVPPHEYRVITISFDPTETTAQALKKKVNFYNTLPAGYPETTWRFLTGDQKNIDRLTKAVGFGYVKIGDDYEHPVGLIILSHDGKIIRYIYGETFLPFQVKMALIEASQGRIGPTVNRLLDVCYSFDPNTNSYVFDVLKVTGAVCLLTLLAFIAFLVITGKKYRRGDNGGT